MNTMEFIREFVKQEESAFKVFGEFLGTRIAEAAFKSIGEFLSKELAENDSASVTVPWGTFSVERRVRNSGDSANTNIAYEPSKAFLKALNSDSKDAIADMYQDDINEDLLKTFADYVAYGFFNPDAPEHKEHLTTASKGAVLNSQEQEYFMNRLAMLIVTIGKDKQRDGMKYRLDLTDNIGHGYYDFEYNDDKISVKFTADKPFKQAVKNDAAMATDI